MATERQSRKRASKPLAHYVLRRCQSSHACALCTETIHLGQQYFDGGYGRRAHYECGMAQLLDLRARGEHA